MVHYFAMEKMLRVTLWWTGVVREETPSHSIYSLTLTNSTSSHTDVGRCQSSGAPAASAASLSGASVDIFIIMHNVQTSTETHINNMFMHISSVLVATHRKHTLTSLYITAFLL